jgi:hypothetical protein
MENNRDDKKEEGPVSREQLYAEVWAEPMTKVALKCKVSSSFMACVCTWLNVPRPERGYWAKLAVGNISKQPPLPEAEPGDDLEWNRYAEEGERKEWEAKQILWRREEEERRRVKAIKESQDELSEIIMAWVKAKGIEDFLLTLSGEPTTLMRNRKQLSWSG